jgi:hypothetical protein
MQLAPAAHGAPRPKRPQCGVEGLLGQMLGPPINNPSSEETHFKPRTMTRERTWANTTRVDEAVCWGRPENAGLYVDGGFSKLIALLRICPLMIITYCWLEFTTKTMPRIFVATTNCCA